MKPDWSPQEVTGHDDGAASAFGNEILFTGYRWNPETGYYQARHREYHPLLGRFMQRDPLGYVDGGNLYAGYFVMWGGVDPWGLFLVRHEYRYSVPRMVSERRNFRRVNERWESLLVLDMETGDCKRIGINVQYLAFDVRYERDLELWRLKGFPDVASDVYTAAGAAGVCAVGCTVAGNPIGGGKMALFAARLAAVGFVLDAISDESLVGIEGIQRGAWSGWTRLRVQGAYVIETLPCKAVCHHDSVEDTAKHLKTAGIGSRGIYLGAYYVGNDRSRSYTLNGAIADNSVTLFTYHEGVRYGGHGTGRMFRYVEPMALNVERLFREGASPGLLAQHDVTPDPSMINLGARPLYDFRVAGSGWGTRTHGVRNPD
ncbi:MAG: RHS repeat-associated core domain-containing protein [Phycisphaeraceae bacterium]|nr:RHS repeat-associated core domain-containing protein [Phycisphaeraceae bacterium]